MKMIKKLGMILLSLCLVVPFISLKTYAADGRISFSDPETAAGKTFDVDCAVRTQSASIGNVELTLSYDSGAIEFVSGDGVTAGDDGEVKYSGSGNGTELKFTMKFKALKEGEASIKVGSASVSSSDGTQLDCQQGASAVKIAKGDGSTDTTDDNTSGAEDIEVEVDGEKYKLSDNFSESDIPSGFVKAEMTFESQKRQMVSQESSGLYLGYLINSEGTGAFYLYEEETATFAPFEQVNISDTTSIVLLSGDISSKLPEGYEKVKLTMNDHDFPAWQSSSSDGFYVIYAINSNGTKGLYQYDNDEGTFQRFVPEETESKSGNSLLGKLKTFLEDHLEVIILAAGLGLLIFIVLLIVFGVKLHNRNIELDELYDEYGIDEDEEDLSRQMPAIQDKTEKRGRFRKPALEEEDEFDGYDEDDFDEYDDDDFEYDDSDDLDAALGELPRSYEYKKEKEDEFTIDFVDLDL